MLHQSHLQISFLYVMITAAAQLNNFESAAVSLCVGGYVKYCPWMLSGI